MCDRDVDSIVRVGVQMRMWVLTMMIESGQPRMWGCGCSFTTRPFDVAPVKVGILQVTKVALTCIPSANGGKTGCNVDMVVSVGTDAAKRISRRATAIADATAVQHAAHV